MYICDEIKHLTMKTNNYIQKLTIGLFLFAGLTAYANSTDPIVRESKNEVPTNETPWELNNEYVEIVLEDEPQDEAEYLSEIILNWDVTQARKFLGRKQPFTTIFKSNKGLAEVTYNSKGVVVLTEKRLENVVLPAQLRMLMYKRYEDWTIVENKYHVTYKEGDDVERTYFLTIEKEGETKMIKIDV